MKNIRERIHECSYCRRKFVKSSDERAGNPFCDECLVERSKQPLPIAVVLQSDGYCTLTLTTQNNLQDG